MTDLGTLVQSLRQVQANCAAEHWDFSAKAVGQAIQRLDALDKLMPRCEQLSTLPLYADVTSNWVSFRDLLRDLLALKGTP